MIYLENYDNQYITFLIKKNDFELYNYIFRYIKSITYGKYTLFYNQSKYMIIKDLQYICKNKFKRLTSSIIKEYITQMFLCENREDMDIIITSLRKSLKKFNFFKKNQDIDYHLNNIQTLDSELFIVYTKRISQYLQTINKKAQLEFKIQFIQCLQNNEDLRIFIFNFIDKLWTIAK